MRHIFECLVPYFDLLLDFFFSVLVIGLKEVECCNCGTVLRWLYGCSHTQTLSKGWSFSSIAEDERRELCQIAICYIPQD